MDAITNLIGTWLNANRPGIAYVETYTKYVPIEDEGGDDWGWQYDEADARTPIEVPTRAITASRVWTGGRVYWPRRSSDSAVRGGVCVGDGNDLNAIKVQIWDDLSSALGDEDATALVRDWTDLAIEWWAQDEAGYNAARQAEGAAQVALKTAIDRAVGLGLDVWAICGGLSRSETIRTEDVIETTQAMASATAQIEVLCKAEEDSIAERTRTPIVIQIGNPMGGRKVGSRIVSVSGLVDKDGARPWTCDDTLTGYVTDPAWAVAWVWYNKSHVSAWCLATAQGRGIVHANGESEGEISAQDVCRAHGVPVPVREDTEGNW